MTRARIIHKVSTPTYGEFYARAAARHGPVIRGAHLDINPFDDGMLRDPFKMARRFAHLLARETGQPFAWGWFDDPQWGMRPGCWPAEMTPPATFQDGRTDRPLTDNAPDGKLPV